MRAKPVKTTVAQYLAGLPADRRKAVEAVRKVIRKNLPRGYVESMGFGMISYEIPLSHYPDTYNGQPLPYVCLASQKNHCSLYMMGAYASGQAARLKAAFKATGKKLDMGKACIRFRTPDDLPLPAIGELVAEISVADFIAYCEAARMAR
jgi:uncharacterized protein YdhG (YjbR/CyaY superfamily)